MKSIKALCMLGLALTMSACGGTESVDTGAVRVDEGGPVAVTTLDLTSEDSAYVVDVREDGSVADDLIVRRIAGDSEAASWLTGLQAHLGLVAFEPGSQLVLVTPMVDQNEFAPEQIAERARQHQGAERPCPEDCVHCPEDNVFLCQALCGNVGAQR
jgi:hypothetical protein